MGVPDVIFFAKTLGSLQSLIDALVPNAWQSFAGVPSIPGEGTTVKCWGWLEQLRERLAMTYMGGGDSAM